MKLVVLTLMLALTRAESPFAARDGLTHVVRVGRLGRQVVHQVGGGAGIKLGRKVRRQGRRGNSVGRLLQPTPALHLVNVAPNPFQFQAQPLTQVRALSQADAGLLTNDIHPLNIHHSAVHPGNPFGFSHNHFNPAIAPFPLTPVAAPLPPTHVFAPFPSTPVVAPLPPAQVAATFSPAPVASPLPPAPIAARTIPLEYGAPATIAPEVKVQAPTGVYGAPLPSYQETESLSDYQEPEPTTPSPTPATTPAPTTTPFPTTTPAPAVIVSARDSYIAVPRQPAASVRETYSAAPSAPVAVVKANLKAATRSEPIAIVRSHANVPAETSVFDYSFESANGIKQQATGSLRTVDDNEVSVMEGSYEFIGADSVVYTVQWYADETGFHATAPHLPRSVEPNHPEVAAAVRAQIAFAAKEDALSARKTAASTKSTSYSAPPPSYSAPADYLPSYQ